MQGLRRSANLPGNTAAPDPRDPRGETTSARLPRPLLPASIIVANLAHELHPPLNSLLTLARFLADNEEGNLTAKQIDYVQTIYAAGTHLLSILDDSLGPVKSDPAQSETASDYDEAEHWTDTGLSAFTMTRAIPARPYRGRRNRRSDEPVVLIADGDPSSAASLLGVVRENGYQGVVATNFATVRVLARGLPPEAILLGAGLSAIDGLNVLDLLRSDPETCRIPLSIINLETQRCLCLPAEPPGPIDRRPERTLGRLAAAAGRPIAKLLLVGSDAAPWRHHGVSVRMVKTREQALDALGAETFDAMVIAPGPGDTSALSLLQVLLASGIAADLALALLGPVDASMSGADRSSEIAVFHHRARIYELLDETALFLDHSISAAPAPQTIGSGTWRHLPSPQLAGRKVLVVDDDVRNIYAMTGALEQEGMVVVHAEDGREGLAMLRDNPDTEAAIVAITAPQTDGYEAIRSMRGLANGRSLTIIAVVDSGAPGDLERCSNAGSSDYIFRPVNIEQLLALLRTWLARPGRA